VTVPFLVQIEIQIDVPASAKTQNRRPQPPVR
jgi:hypothetical protein